MIRWRLFIPTLTLFTIAVGLSPLNAGYMNTGGGGNHIDSHDFTFFPTASAWDPGPNTARIDGHPAVGGATFSIAGAGLSAVAGADTDHVGSTVAITDLGVPGFTTAADYAAAVSAALDVWASVSGFTNLGEVADGGVDFGASEASGGHLGDIRVAAWEISTAGVLAHAFQPGTEDEFIAGNIGGDLHFDLAGRTWVDDPGDTTGDDTFDFFTVLLHELGHSLGLGHSGVSGSVMEPVYAGARRTLHPDDIAGIRALYTPEPGSIILTGLVGAGVLGHRLRKRRKSKAKSSE